MNWQKFTAESYKPNPGKTVDIRIVLAAMIVKHKLRLDDRGTIDMIQESIYIQYFCGFKSFTTKKAFDPSLFVDIRKRPGAEEFSKFNQLVIEKSERIKPLGRPPEKVKETASERYRKRKKAAQRNHVEAKFGQAKRGYRLNNVKARLKDTSGSWVNAIIFMLFSKWVEKIEFLLKTEYFFFRQRILLSVA